jgi:hypothetical protein
MENNEYNLNMLDDVRFMDLDFLIEFFFFFLLFFCVFLIILFNEFFFNG